MKTQRQRSQELTRKDKRRHNLESKVARIHHAFVVDKDTHYKNRLTSLQTNLTTLHQGNNQLYLRRLHDLEESRDLELVRLRLYEEYRVSRSRIEFQEDIEMAKNEHESLVKLCKEKLYESIEKKVKNLKEERLLMDVANSHSYAMDYSRTKYQKNTRSHTANGWDSSSNLDFGKDSANESATDTGTERRSLRRRAATGSANANNKDRMKFSTNSALIEEEQSDFQSGYSTTGTGRSKTSFNSRINGNAKNTEPDSDFLQYMSDNSDLHALLFGEADPKEPNKKKHKNSQRYSTKSAPPLPSLTFDEVTEDIALIRQLTGQPPAPFKARTE